MDTPPHHITRPGPGDLDRRTGTAVVRDGGPGPVRAVGVIFWIRPATPGTDRVSGGDDAARFAASPTAPSTDGGGVVPGRAGGATRRGDVPDWSTVEVTTGRVPFLPLDTLTVPGHGYRSGIAGGPGGRCRHRAARRGRG
jgi:hypothetical protein